MFWDRYNNLCLEKKETASSIAKKLNMAPSTVTSWKQNEKLPNGKYLLAIADYFNVSVDYLLCRTDVPEVAQSKSENSPGKKEIILKITGDNVQIDEIK